MSNDIKKQLKNRRTRNYLNKDFDSFRSSLLSYARAYFPDKIKDFSDSSVGGLFLDMAAYVGDVNSFYLDHQFSELNVLTATETKNIERHINAAGIEITGASPAVVDIDIYIVVPAVSNGNGYEPKKSNLPVVKAGSIAKANTGGVTFELLEDADFRETDSIGNLKATIILDQVNTSGVPETFILKLTRTFISGKTEIETFNINDTFVPFRQLTLSNENITEIVSVEDSEGNRYYEVDSLTQDVVFAGILNKGDDNDLVEQNLELKPAPYRYIKQTNFKTGLTTITFGSGQAGTLDDDIVPDPSELAIPLYGKKNFSKFALDPGSLLQTQTLGISPINTTITVNYRYGGGLRHNVGQSTIRTFSTLNITFPGNPTQGEAQLVRNSIDIVNEDIARGGEDALSLEEIKAKVPAYRNSQSRIVSKEDLLARVYTMPSSFGRVFRAGIRSNPNNPLATQLFIISRDSNRKLTVSPDALKKNLRVYLNKFRMISDAIDILDAAVVNYNVEFSVACEPNVNRNVVVQTIISSLKSYFDIKNFQIDQPISRSEVMNIIINQSGVVSLLDLKFRNVSGTYQERSYSEISFNMEANEFRGLIIGEPGSIFEMRYPDFDIIGTAY